MALYVHYGCHHCAPPGWLNFDASPTLRLERLPVIGGFVRKNTNRFPSNVLYGDIVCGLPVKENSCDGVYCSHVLEHLALEDCRRALLNTYRMMKKSGLFRMVLPDFEHCVKNYEIAGGDPSRIEKFMKQSGLGQFKRPRGLYAVLIESFGNSAHRWMWDFGSLRYELEKTGFQNIRRAHIGDSEDSMFGVVEEKGRWENALGIECKK